MYFKHLRHEQNGKWWRINECDEDEEGKQQKHRKTKKIKLQIFF